MLPYIVETSFLTCHVGLLFGRISAMWFRFLSVWCIGGLFSLASAVTYCIDPQTGNDASEGSPQAPWKTMAPLNAKTLVAGDCVQVRPGTVVGSLAPKMQGNPKSPVRIEFAPGVYDWQAEGLNEEKMMISNTNDAPDMPKRVMLDFHDAAYVRVEGKGALLRCRGRMMEIHMEGCDHITFKGIAIDYARPTVSEYTALEVGEESAVFRIHKDSKYRIDGEGKLYWVGDGWEEEARNGFVQQYTAQPLHVFNAGGNKGLWGKVTELAPGKVKMEFGEKKNPGFVKGATYQFRHVRREYASVFCNNSGHIRYENVSFHFMHGMGVLSQFSHDLSFNGVTVAPRKGSGRTCSAWADILHFSGCYGQITVDKCLLSASHDDAINVHGTHLLVTDIRDRRHLTLTFKHGQTWGFTAYRRGDEVEFINTASLLPLGGINRVAEAALSPDGRGMELTLEQDMPEGVCANDWCLENVTATPAVTVTKSRIQLIPTRAFLLTTRRPVVVENCTFIGTHNAAILVADDARSWYESGMVRDMTIKGNTFTECGEPVIKVHPENRSFDAPVHTGIRIERNTFNLLGRGAVGLKSAGDVLIQGNIIRAAHEGETVLQEHCGKVLILQRGEAENDK